MTLALGRGLASEGVAHGTVVKKGVKGFGVHNGVGGQQRERVFSNDPGFLRCTTIPFGTSALIQLSAWPENAEEQH